MHSYRVKNFMGFEGMQQARTCMLCPGVCSNLREDSASLLPGCAGLASSAGGGEDFSSVASAFSIAASDRSNLATAGAQWGVMRLALLAQGQVQRLAGWL